LLKWGSVKTSLRLKSKKNYGILSKLFGSNERELRKLQPIVDKINSFEDGIGRLSDEELKAKTQEFKKESAGGKLWMK